MNDDSRFPSLRWGLSTLGCPEASLEQAVKTADDFGMEFLEIRTISGSNKVSEMLGRPENHAAAERLVAAGRVRVLDSSFRIASTDPDAKAELLNVARTADEFGIPYIRLFGGFSGEPTPEVFRDCANNLTWFKAQKFRARLALETHDGFAWSPRVLALMEHCGEPIPVIWDAHHTFQSGGEPFADSFRALRPHIIDVHFKDSHFGTRDGERRLVQDLPGAGEVPLTELFALLERERFDAPVVLEYEKLWHPYLPELPLALAAWRKLIAKTGSCPDGTNAGGTK